MCFFNFVHKEAIEDLVFQDIRKILKDGEIDPSKVIITKSDDLSDELKLLENRLKRIKHKFQKQLEAFEAEIISLEELQQAKKRVSLEECEIKEQINQIKNKQVSEDLGEQLKPQFDGIDEIIESNDPTAIKLWLKERIHKIEVLNKSDVKIEYRLPW